VIAQEQRRRAPRPPLVRAPRRSPEGNERLTAATAVLLLVLLAVEGATLISLRQFLSVHVFVGVLLIPPVALKLASTGWRFLRYYTGDREYVVKGPPMPLMRFLVAPVLVFSTLMLFASGVGLVVFGPGHPLVVGLHKASFVVWFGATSIHVLAYALRVPQLVGADLARRTRTRGAALRGWALAGSVAAGAVLGVWSLQGVPAWQHWMWF
jgi:hypothetical protein